MPRIQWMKEEDKLVQGGLDRGVLYPATSPSDDVVDAVNLATNPGMVATGADVTVASNLVHNPKFRKTSLTVVSTNLVYNPRAINLTSITGYASGETLAAVAVPDPPAPGLTTAVRVTTGAGTGVKFLSGALAGKRTLGMWVRRVSGTSNFQVAFGGVSASANNANLPVGTWVWLTFSIDSTNTLNEPGIRATAAGAGDVIEVTGVVAVAGSVLPTQTYFDGDTADDANFTYDWTGTANNSTSTMKAKVPTKYTFGSEVGERWLVDGVLRFSTSVVGNTGGNRLLISYMDLAANTAYAIMVRLRRVAGAGGLAIGSDGWGAPIPAGAIVSGTANLDPATNGVWTEYTLMVNTPAGGPWRLFLYPLPGAETSRWEIEYIKVAHAGSVTYFDGSTAAEDGFTYRWTGAADDSTSEKRAKSVVDTAASPDQSVAYQRVEEGRTFARFLLIGWWPIGINFLHGIELPANVERTAEMRVRASRTMRVTPRWRSHPSGYDNRTPVDLPAGEWVNIRWTDVAEQVNTMPGLLLDGITGHQPGDTLDVDYVLLVDGRYDGSYFDGDSTQNGLYRYEWEGEPHKSRSLRYSLSNKAVPWNGLVNVTESGQQETNTYYVNGRKFLTTVTPREYQAKIQAVTFPDEFAEICGIAEAADGLFLDSQVPDQFGLSYRTHYADGKGYKIHLLYGVTAAMSDVSYQSLGGGGNDPTMFEFDISGTPQQLEGFRPTAHVIIDSRNLSPLTLANIENILYGSVTGHATIPTIQSLFDMMNYGDIVVIRDHGDGTWEAEGSYKYISVDPDTGRFMITNITVEDQGDGSYKIASTNEPIV